MSATEKEWFRNEFDFSFDFFDEILIVLVIVIFDESSQKIKRVFPETQFESLFLSLKPK